MIEIISKENCCGCTACASVCPKDAITTKGLSSLALIKKNALIVVNALPFVLATNLFTIKKGKRTR